LGGHRNRFYYLWTLDSCSRGEALDKGDLCDFFGVEAEPTNLISPLFIAVLMIHIGKTNQNTDETHLSQLIRHFNLNMCGIGALAFYLLSCFLVTKDFTNNEDWHHVKIMVGLTDHDHNKSNCKSVQQRSYYDAFHARVLEIPHMP
jgi:hypothetical protein